MKKITMFLRRQLRWKNKNQTQIENQSHKKKSSNQLYLICPLENRQLIELQEDIENYLFHCFQGKKQQEQCHLHFISRPSYPINTR